MPKLYKAILKFFQIMLKKLIFVSLKKLALKDKVVKAFLSLFIFVFTV